MHEEMAQSLAEAHNHAYETDDEPAAPQANIRGHASVVRTHATECVPAHMRTPDDA